LYRTFRDDGNVYLLFEYVSGGELDHYFRARSRCFDLHTAKFYAAELVLSLEYLHDHASTAHRDIKLNNVMINSEGHLRLCDFGFARHLDEGELAYTLVGTPEYLPPDILKGKGYSTACDWWSLGITVYKMLNGHGPFFRNTRAAIFQSIMEGKFEFPSHFDPCTRDLVKQLLNPNDKKRLGAGKGGAGAIKAHPWFQDMDWEKLQREEVIPPFIPEPIENLYDVKDHREPPDTVPENYKKLFCDF
jgi:serine/threonine protein kinase